MKTKLIYIRGYPGNHDSDSVTSLESMLGDEFEFVSPKYYFHRPCTTMKGLKILCGLKEQGQDVIIVGSSLGGFYANYLADRLQLPCILINPSLHPAESLLKYGHDDKEDWLQSYQQFEDEACLTKGQKTVIIGLEDITVIPRHNGFQLQDEARMVLLKDEGHQLKRKSSFETVVDEIRWLNNQIIDYPTEGDK